MLLDSLSTYVGLLVALSIATERVVEIVKAAVPYLREGEATSLKEVHRRALLHLVAVISGVLVAYFARPALPPELVGTSPKPALLFALGLLASGGSAMWNSALGYVEAIRNVRRDVRNAVDDIGAAAADRRQARIPEQLR